jgi:hypothetical protein
MGREYRKTHHLPCIEIKHCGDIHHFALKVKMGEVRYPDMVLVYRVCGEEEVRILYPDILGLFPFSPSSPIRFNTE